MLSYSERKNKMPDISITGVTSGSGSLSNRIDFVGDTDQFDILLRGGELYRFEANNAFGAGGGLADPTLTLRTGAGGFLDFDDDGGPGLNSRIDRRTGTGFQSLFAEGACQPVLTGMLL